MQRLLMLLLLWFPTMVRADPRDDPRDPVARAHFEKGNRLYGLQDFEGAIGEYKAGALIESIPVFEFALGQSYRQLHKYKEAIWYFERFVKHCPPEGELRKGTLNLIDKLTKAMDQEPTASQIPPASQLPPPSAGIQLPPLVAEQPTTKTVITYGEPWYQDGVGWGVAGAGAVASGIAGYLLVDGGHLRDEANAELFQKRKGELSDQSDSRYQAGVVIGAVGLAVLTAGVIKLVIAPPDRIQHVFLSVTRDGIALSGPF